MTQVITRFFDSAATALTVKRTLEFERFPKNDLLIFKDADGLAEALIRENVEEDTAAAYAEKVKDGGAVLLARASYQPLGAAQLTRDTCAEMGADELDGLTEEVYVKDSSYKSLSVFTSHPLMLTRRLDTEPTGYYMADWPIPLISRRKPVEPFMDNKHARMANFPIPLISHRKPWDKFAFPRHMRMAKFPIPLISRRKPYDKFAFPRHMRMADYVLPLLSDRKPIDRFAFPRHARMANWPFPLLINGETGTNALIPGGPRMANFPIPLISKREPADKFAFPRHARMADILIPLISKRKPFTKSVIKRHGRMADMILPLTVKHAEAKGVSKSEGFSLSKFFGWPTLKSR